MIVLRDKNFSSKKKDNKEDKKPRLRNNVKGNIGGAALLTGIGTALSAYGKGSQEGEKELYKMAQEFDERLVNEVRAGNGIAYSAYKKINNTPKDELRREFVKFVKKAKPAKGKLLNRYNRALLKGAAKGSIIPLAFGGLGIAANVNLRNKYKKDKAKYERDLKEWEERQKNKNN